MDLTNIWHLGLQPIIFILNKKHPFGKAFEFKVSYKSVFKPLVFKTLMNLPFGFMCIHKLLLSLLVERKNLEHLVTLAIDKMKCLLHLQNINFKSKANYRHWDHSVERNVDLGLTLGQHLMFFQNLNGIDLVLLDVLDWTLQWEDHLNLQILKEGKYLDEENIRKSN